MRRTAYSLTTCGPFSASRTAFPIILLGNHIADYEWRCNCVGSARVARRLPGSAHAGLAQVLPASLLSSQFSAD